MLKRYAYKRAHGAPLSDAMDDVFCHRRVRSLSLLHPRMFSDSTQKGQSNPFLLSSTLATTTPVSAIMDVLHAFCGIPDEECSVGDGDNNGEVISVGTADSEVLCTHVMMPYLYRLQLVSWRM